MSGDEVPIVFLCMKCKTRPRIAGGALLCPFCLQCQRELDDAEDYRKSLLEPPNLRDRFAMATLTGMLSSSTPADDITTLSQDYARMAYALADAMLERRKK